MVETVSVILSGFSIGFASVHSERNFFCFLASEILTEPDFVATAGLFDGSTKRGSMSPKIDVTWIGVGVEGSSIEPEFDFDSFDRVGIGFSNEISSGFETCCVDVWTRTWIFSFSQDFAIVNGSDDGSCGSVVSKNCFCFSISYLCEVIRFLTSTVSVLSKENPSTKDSSNEDVN